MLNLNKKEVRELSYQFGGSWCDCIHQVIEKITPALVAGYCVNKEFPEQHAPFRDETGVRYGYFLGKKTKQVVVDDKEVETQYRLVAGFGDYTNRAKETLQSCLTAICAIAEFERRPAQDVARDVIAADASMAPAAPEEILQERLGLPISEGARRYQQSEWSP